MATSALLRALRRPSSEAAQRLATSANVRAVTGYRHLNNRNLSVFNEFSKQLKGEAKSNPEFQKSMREFGEKLGVVKEDLKIRTKKTTETIYKSVDGVWSEAEETSKKVTANIKEKMFAAKEEVKESFGLGKEESTSCRDGLPEASKHEKTEAPSHSDGMSEEATSSHTLFAKLKSTISSASPVVSGAFAKLKDTRASTLAKQGYEIVKDELSSSSSRKKKYQARHASAAVEKSTRTDIVIIPTKKSVLGEKWEAFKNQMQGHPVYKRLNEYTKPVVTRGQEVAEDVRERWETSDNPVVQKIQDLNESFLEETAAAVTFREIRQRDPSFSLSDFVADVQDMIRPVLTAYSKGDVETLKKYCTKEVIERCKGERQAYASQGIFFDHKILHISEADVLETKMFGSAPVIILRFQTQQIYCVRDREGQVTEGGQDTIQTVFYSWAMQLLESDEVPEAESYYPVWRLREMQQAGVRALI
ncbi:mitochondrial import inner membrane translocase subunit TIM44-2-like [Phragmites australis]|uniref:mitochondrial import inner membrane translocase subunit TIM44-2-like n=1 Tax=Phragmites australis TaxID=29695 RepID=UPI002D77ECCE|nr:mitochondrial import inner membrane translocase subunit TIM44-2-like [Phragmites australis]